MDNKKIIWIIITIVLILYAGYCFMKLMESSKTISGTECAMSGGHISDPSGCNNNEKSIGTISGLGSPFKCCVPK
jgi:hypothetical protein